MCTKLLKKVIPIAMLFCTSIFAGALPAPQSIPEAPQFLSLREAIALSLRGNPTIQVAELARVLDKFGLATAIHTYQPQWSQLGVTATLANHAPPQWNATTGVTWNTTAGTSFGVTQTNNLLGGPGSTQVQVTQHLLRGFGDVNRVTLDNGWDNEYVARLTFKNNVTQVVVNVIGAYRALVQNENNLEISERTLSNQEKGVAQSELRVKSGQMAPADLLEQKANLEATRLSVVQQQQTLENAYQSFLSLLGMPVNKKIIVDRNIIFDNQALPTQEKCIEMAFKNNTAYQQALLSLKVTKRALITAKDARKWQLDVTGADTVGAQTTIPGQTPIPINNNPTLTFTLGIPIDNVGMRQAIVSAQIQIQDAEINLAQRKKDLERTVVTQYENVENQAQQINIAQNNVDMQKKTVDNARLKLQYGRISVFELDGLEDTLLTDETNLIAAKINYLNAVTTLNQTLGITLDKWKIHLRY